MTHVQLIALIAGVVVLFLLLVIAIWIRTEKRSRATRYTDQLPTWGGNYREALAHRARKPSRIRHIGDKRDR